MAKRSVRSVRKMAGVQDLVRKIRLPISALLSLGLWSDPESYLLGCSLWGWSLIMQVVVFSSMECLLGMASVLC